MKFKSFFVVFLTLVIGAGCFYVGKDLSRRRPLWNDELYTQINTVAPLSYTELMSGKSVEGNNAPLFYVIQKALCERLGYQFEGKWSGEWFVHDERSQAVLRLTSNVFMSSAIALVFFSVASFYPMRFAVLAIAVMLSLPATWLFWAEARPYSLWILLSVVQSLFLLRTISERSGNGFSWLGLVLSNILLCFTIAFGAVQSFAVCAVLWLFKERRWVRYLGLGVVPWMVAMFYFNHSPKFKYWFHDGPVRLVLDNVPLECWILLLLFVCYWITTMHSMEIQDQARQIRGAYLTFTVMISAAAAGILGFLKYNAGAGTEGFAVSSRYFLFLVPTVVIAVTVAVYNFHERFKDDPWLRVNLWLVVCGFLALRAFKTYIYLLASGTFMHVIK